MNQIIPYSLTIYFSIAAFSIILAIVAGVLARIENRWYLDHYNVITIICVALAFLPVFQILVPVLFVLYWVWAAVICISYVIAKKLMKKE